VKLSEAIAAVVTILANPGVANLNAEGFDGREEREDIAARSRKGGMWARVVIIGETIQNTGGDPLTATIQFGVWLSLPFRPSPAAAPWSLMADLRGAVEARLLAATWPEDMSTPTDVRGQTLYTLNDAKAGIARSLVQWSQRVDLDLTPEPVDLPDLETIVHDQKHLVDGADPAPTITTEIDLT
jgi:hypothetical protein